MIGDQSIYIRSRRSNLDSCFNIISWNRRHWTISRLLFLAQTPAPLVELDNERSVTHDNHPRPIPDLLALPCPCAVHKFPGTWSPSSLTQSVPTHPILTSQPNHNNKEVPGAPVSEDGRPVPSLSRVALRPAAEFVRTTITAAAVSSSDRRLQVEDQKLTIGQVRKIGQVEQVFRSPHPPENEYA